jgi:SOS-response transcriptional repressor LexA
MGTNFSPQVFPMSNSFSYRVKSLRESMGLSQSELARKIKKTPQSVQKWENGGAARRDAIKSLAAALQTTEGYLLAGDSATTIDAPSDEARSIVLAPLVEWSNLEMPVYEIIDKGLFKKRIPVIAGIHNDSTVCTIIEGGDWMDDRLKDGTMVFVNKDVDSNDLKSGALVIAKFGGRTAPRKLMIDGDKMFLVTTNETMPKQVTEMQESDKIIGVITGAFVPF